MMRNLFSSLAAIIIFCCIAPGILEGATLHVASNGFDSITCGGRSTPCRSISQAIANAFDRDRIVVGPGSYGPGVEGVEGPPGCVCMIKIDKSLTLVSRDGAEVTVLDVAGADFRGVLIESDWVVFGKRNKGFTITNSRRAGLILAGNPSNVKVQGNVAVNNGANGNDAFQFEGFRHTVIGNKAINNARGGFVISGEDHIVTGNLATGNLQGFDVRFTGRFTRNAIIGNNLDGLILSGPGEIVISHNNILGNQQIGIGINSLFGGIITRNNIFGNATLAGSFGFTNTSGALVNAPHNFWVAASGPGPDPADEVFDSPGSTTIVDPVATKEFNIRVQARD